MYLAQKLGDELMSTLRCIVSIFSGPFNVHLRVAVTMMPLIFFNELMRYFIAYLEGGSYPQCNVQSVTGFYTAQPGTKYVVNLIFAQFTSSQNSLAFLSLKQLLWCGS